MSRHWVYVILWVCFVTYLSAMPGVSLPKFELFSADKLAHALVYGVMTLLMLAAKSANLQGEQGKLVLRDYVTAIGVSIAYGILMEFMQHAFFPGRTYELDDMIANAIGALLAGLAFFFYFGKGRRN